MNMLSVIFLHLMPDIYKHYIIRRYHWLTIFSPGRFSDLKSYIYTPIFITFDALKHERERERRTVTRRIVHCHKRRERKGERLKQPHIFFLFPPLFSSHYSTCTVYLAWILFMYGYYKVSFIHNDSELV